MRTSKIENNISYKRLQTVSPDVPFPKIRLPTLQGQDLLPLTESTEHPPTATLPPRLPVTIDTFDHSSPPGGTSDPVLTYIPFILTPTPPIQAFSFVLHLRMLLFLVEMISLLFSLVSLRWHNNCRSYFWVLGGRNLGVVFNFLAVCFSGELMHTAVSLLSGTCLPLG